MTLFRAHTVILQNNEIIVVCSNNLQITQPVLSIFSRTVPVSRCSFDHYLLTFQFGMHYTITRYFCLSRTWRVTTVSILVYHSNHFALYAILSTQHWFSSTIYFRSFFLVPEFLITPHTSFKGSLFPCYSKFMLIHFLSSSSMSSYNLSDWKISSLHHVYFDRESSERLVLTGYALPQDGRRQSLGPIPRCRAGKTMGKVLQKSAPAWITCSCVCHERSYHTFSLRDSANLRVIICTLFVRL